MKKYLVLYQSTVSAIEQMSKATPEQASAGMDMWMQWMQRCGSVIVDGGSPVGTTITFSSGGKRVETKSNAGGYSVLQAESIDALAKVLEGHPHFHAPGATIEVHEFLSMPGM